MILFQILAGLFSLGILVLVHEAGHFFVARALGVQVEKFSIGWGKALWKRTGKDGVVYQMGSFPFGGFVLMKGEVQFREAMNKGLKEFPYEEGSFFSAQPWKRILIALAGPAINVLFAILLLGIVYGIGFEYSSYPSRILLADGDTPAVQAGLQDGDLIIHLDGKEVLHFSDLQRIITSNPENDIPFTLLRNNLVIEGTLRPRLDPDRGAGVLGVYPAVEPVIAQNLELPEGQILAAGDRVLRANGAPIEYTLDLARVVAESNGSITLDVLRCTDEVQLSVVPDFDEEMNPSLPIAFEAQVFHTPTYTFFQAINKGVEEVQETLALTFQSLGILFRGVNPSAAVSGPLRISVMVGEAATLGFSQSIGTGFRLIAQFMAIISIALAFGNMLPIPVLDGGQALMYTYEWISRRALTPRTITAFQSVGGGLVILLLVWALFSDVLFIINR